MARAEARGVDGAWLDALFGFVPPPDAVLFLDVDAEASLARRVRRPGSVRSGPRSRAVGGPARELPPVPGAAVRLLRPLRGRRRLHPHRMPPARSSRSASGSCARPMRSWPPRTPAAWRAAAAPMTRIVHLSDFHFDGSPELRRALRSLVDSAIAREPDLVVVTGDLSADGRPAELDEVARELARFGAVPRVVIPGNRDLEPSVGPPGEARPLPVDSDLDYFLALEPALTLGFDDPGRDAGSTARPGRGRPGGGLDRTVRPARPGPSRRGRPRRRRELDAAAAVRGARGRRAPDAPRRARRAARLRAPPRAPAGARAQAARRRPVAPSRRRPRAARATWASTSPCTGTSTAPTPGSSRTAAARSSSPAPARSSTTAGVTRATSKSLRNVADLRSGDGPSRPAGPRCCTRGARAVRR